MFNSQAGQNWLNFLKKLQDEGIGRSVGRASGTTNGTTLGANFSQGDAAITFESIANLRGWCYQAAAAGGKVDVGVAYLPKPAGATGGVIIGGASLWITDQGTTDQQQGAWEFVKFAASPEIQAFFASNTGYYPTRKAAYDQQLMKDALAKYPQFQVAVDQLRGTKASSGHPGRGVRHLRRHTSAGGRRDGAVPARQLSDGERRPRRRSQQSQRQPGRIQLYGQALTKSSIIQQNAA